MPRSLDAGMNWVMLRVTKAAGLRNLAFAHVHLGQETTESQLIVTEFVGGMERQAGRRPRWRSSVARVSGASQSFGLRQQVSWPKVWRSGRVDFHHDGTSTQAERRTSWRGIQPTVLRHADMRNHNKFAVLKLHQNVIRH